MLAIWATQSWSISGHVSYSIMIHLWSFELFNHGPVSGCVSYSIMVHLWPCELLNHGPSLAMWATQSWSVAGHVSYSIMMSMVMWATQGPSIYGNVSYSIMVHLWPCELLNHGPVSGHVNYSIMVQSLAMWATQSWSISGYMSYSVMVHLSLCELLSHGDLFHHDQCPWGWERAINHGQYQAVHDCMIIQCYQDLNISYHSAGIPTISVTNPRPLHMSAVLFHYTLSSLSCCCSVTWGEEVLHQIFDNWVQHAIKNWTQSDLSFVKMNSQKDLTSMIKGVNWIENQGENWYKMLKNC